MSNVMIDTGNYLAAKAAVMAKPDVVAAYPITPQTTLVEGIANYKASGEYKGEYMPEQAIVAKTKRGLTVVTGCAHPGIIKIVESAKNKFSNNQVYSVFGGFHLMDKDTRVIEGIVNRLEDMAIKKVGPTHCSGKIAEELFEKKYKNHFISIKTGENLSI